VSTGRHAFKHNDAARLIRATAAAGFKVTGVTLKDGAVTVLVESAQPAPAETNEWDEIEPRDGGKGQEDKGATRGQTRAAPARR
jgi:hypothetical protein